MVASPTGGRDDDLDIKCVPRQQPQDISLQIYHSQRMEHWDKRLITLQTDGQIIATKREGLSNICHLSDFDIYIPTKRQLSKKVRPPKKVCFAIKSQQKSSMFLSTENFVHFFCSNNNDLAVKWYKAVQQWRSWYLVHVLGEGQGEDIPNRFLLSKYNQQISSDPDSKKGQAISRHCTEAIKHAQDVRRENTGVVPLEKSRANPSISKQSLITTRELSQGPDRRIYEANDQKNTSNSVRPSVPNDHEPFAVTGLLGRTYTQRKKSQQGRDKQVMGHQGPLCDMLPTKVRGVAPTILKQPQQAPLVNLTPQHQELPQHRKGRGFIPYKVPTAGLVEVATSSEQSISILPVAASQQLKNSEDILRRSNTAQAHNPPSLPEIGGASRKLLSSEAVRFDRNLPATGSRARSGNQHSRVAKISNWDAKTPMIDMSHGSQYVPGSLLANIERY